jgi:hypothetical protein
MGVMILSRLGRLKHKFVGPALRSALRSSRTEETGWKAGPTERAGLTEQGISLAAG